MAPTNQSVKLVLTALLILQCGLVNGAAYNRFILEVERRATFNQGLLSDGVDESLVMDLLKSVTSNSSAESSTCEQTYGFLPCTTTVLGNLFLLAVYGFLLFKAASLLSDGTELLMSVMAPGIVGGLFLPILGALPDTLLIIVSCLSGSKEVAEQQVVIGIGLLAGSTVMSLTALWGACVVVGKCDISGESDAIDLQDTKGFSLYGSGVTVQEKTSHVCCIMGATILPFIIAQIPLIFNLKSGKHASVLIASIVAFLSLLGYCVFQITHPWIQKRRLAFLKHRHTVSSILAMHHKRHGGLILENGEPNEEIIDKVFRELDADNDGVLTKGELRGLIVGLEMNEPDVEITEKVDRVMSELDVDPDDQLTPQEFKNGMRKWIGLATRTVSQSNHVSILPAFHKKSKEELDALTDDDEESETVVDNKFIVCLKAGLFLVGGVVLAGVFADPLVDAVEDFSDATNIPSFFISFVLIPLATSSEGVSALILASRKTKRTASWAYFEIYGSVTMNNTLCLGVFLAIVYVRDLDWNFSAEVLVILVVILVTGFMGSTYTTFKLWMSSIAFLMYPLSLALIYVLDFILGWS